MLVMRPKERDGGGDCSALEGGIHKAVCKCRGRIWCGEGFLAGSKGTLCGPENADDSSSWMGVFSCYFKVFGLV